LKNMRKKLTYYEKKQLRIIGVIIVSLLILWVAFSPYGLLRLFRVHHELSEVKTENERIQEQNKGLQEEIEKLENKDPEYIEEVARKKYGLIKKNEVIFKFKSKEK